MEKEKDYTFNPTDYHLTILVGHAIRTNDYINNHKYNTVLKLDPFIFLPSQYSKKSLQQLLIDYPKHILSTQKKSTIPSETIKPLKLKKLHRISFLTR